MCFNIYGIYEDELLNGKLRYQISLKEVLIGSGGPKADPKPDIQVNGVAVRPHHCKIKSVGTNLILVPIATDYLFLNGIKVNTVK